MVGAAAAVLVLTPKGDQVKPVAVGALEVSIMVLPGHVIVGELVTVWDGPGSTSTLTVVCPVHVLIAPTTV